MRARVRSLIGASLWVCCCASPALGQPQSAQAPARDNPQPANQTARIRGRVVSLESGQALPRAIVRLVWSGVVGEPPSVATDDNGEYVFDGLARGSYTVTAAKSGFATMNYGQRRPSDIGIPVVVETGGDVDRVDFALPRGGAIVVHVVDDVGEPVAGVNVDVLQYRFAGGERRLVPVGPRAFVNYAPTDGTGELRSYGLYPGEHWVRATGRVPGEPAAAASTGRVYAPTYYPGTTSVGEAQRISVTAGREVEVTLPLVVTRPARIEGTVRASDGSTGPTSVFLFAQSYGTTSTGTSRNMFPLFDGRFALSNVMPGTYWIDVTPVSAGKQEFASQPITVSGDDVTGLTVVTSSGTVVRGRIVFDGGGPPDLRPNATVVVPTVIGHGNGGRARLNADWTFEISNVLSPILLGVRFTNPQVPSQRVSSIGWSVKSVLAGGKDVTDKPLEVAGLNEIRDVQIVLTSKQTSISGRLKDQQGNSSSTGSVVLFPEARDLWTLQSRWIAAARPDQNGAYTVQGLPPGRYLAAAVESLEVGEERDIAVLARLAASATAVTLIEDQALTIDLTVAAR